MRWRWLVAGIITQRQLHVPEFVAQARKFALQIEQQAILSGDSGVEALHRLIKEGDAGFQFSQALLECIHRRPSTASAGSTYFTS